MPSAEPEHSVAQLARNSEYAWDEFPSAEYCDHNYTRLREDDAEILGFVRSWFADAAADGPRDGLDVGAGPNLYPALAMLPFCRSITLREYSAANVRWLRSETANLSARWQPFWAAVSEAGRYGDFAEAGRALAERARVEQGSVFDLPPATWDLGTMFFVAESISQDPAEFDAAVRAFVGALRPGSPFAAAFVEQPDGYEVAGRRYPATPVGRTEIVDCLGRVAGETRLARIEMRPAPLRLGYTGMIVAIGRAK